MVCSVLRIGRLREQNQSIPLWEKQTHAFRTPFFFAQAGSVGLYCLRFLSVGHHPTPHFTGQHRKLNVFQRLGRSPRSPGLRIPPVLHPTSPPDQSFFYALDTPASSTQSSLGNLLPDSALVRFVSRNGQNQLGEIPDYLSKRPIDTFETPAQNPSISPSSFSQATPEIKSPPRVKRRSFLRKTPISPFLPIQTPPDSPILIEPKESSPSGNFVFHLHTPAPSMAHRRISHPYAQLPTDPTAILGFPRSPSQEFHSCDEQSPGHPSPPSSSTSPMSRPLGKVSSKAESLCPSLLVHPGGGSPFLASASRNQALTIPRPASADYTGDTLGRTSPNIFTSQSTGAITSAKLVPFSASARASVVSESPSYISEHVYRGGASPTVPYELEEHYDYMGPESAFPMSGGTGSSPCRNEPRQAISSSDLVSYVEGSELEPPNSGVERKPSFPVPGALFPIPEEDTQAELSGSRSRSDPSSSGSVMVTAAGSLHSLPSSNYGAFAVSFTSTSGSFTVVNHPTPGTSGVGSRPTPTGIGSLSIINTPAQATFRGTGTPGSPPNVGTLRFGTRESYTGSGDLNDGTEMSGACMNGLYEELEEWGCEWILQNQQQSGPSAGRA